MTYLKLALHVLVGIVLGLLYQGSGQDGGRSIQNMGFFLVTLVYLAYTSMMPAVLRCELIAIYLNSRFMLHDFCFCFSLGSRSSSRNERT
jgi:hypothetical protein